MGRASVGRINRRRKSKRGLFLDMDAIYAAVNYLMDNASVKRMANWAGLTSGSYLYKQADEGDEDHLPYLVRQIAKQQAALAEPGITFEDACAELICEADHLGADVIERLEIDEAEIEDASRCGAEIMRETGEALVAFSSQFDDGEVTTAESLNTEREIDDAIRALIKAKHLTKAAAQRPRFHRPRSITAGGAS